MKHNISANSWPVYYTRTILLFFWRGEGVAWLIVGIMPLQYILYFEITAIKTDGKVKRITSVLCW